jgi:hypothetical protein
MLSQIQACESLLKLTNDERDKSAIIKEIAELKMTLDLLPTYSSHMKLTAHMHTFTRAVHEK